jgi:hypothetical protein
MNSRSSRLSNAGRICSAFAPTCVLLFVACTVHAQAPASPQASVVPQKQTVLTEHQRDVLRADNLTVKESRTRLHAQQTDESRVAQAELREIQTRYRALEQQEVAPSLAEEQEIILPICKALGVPENRLRECQPDLDYKDPDTGKVVGRVFWNEPKKPDLTTAH